MEVNKEQVLEWLGDLFDPVNEMRHKMNIVAGAILNGSNAVTGISQYGGYSSAIAYINVPAEFLTNLLRGADSLLASGTSLSLATEINTISDALKNPNIDGIPIHATQEKENTEVQVARIMMIDQAAQNKQQIVDNAVPQLKTWQITGHLVSNPYTDSGLVIKPSLILQRSILQDYADSRRPVLFKTHDNRFFWVLIEKFESGYNTNYLNALDVSIQLVEFKVMSVVTETVAKQLSKFVEKIER